MSNFNCYSVSAPAIATSVFDLIGGSNDEPKTYICRSIALQNLDVTNTVYFGDSGTQAFELRVSDGGSNTIIPLKHTKGLFIKGTGAETVAIGIIHDQNTQRD